MEDAPETGIDGQASGGSAHRAVDSRDGQVPEHDTPIRTQGGAVGPGPVPVVDPRSVRGGGSPLPGSVRAYFEPRLAHDLSEVRIHTGDRADRAARSVGALAYTLGHDVVFAAGQYQPDTGAGKRLLAHELTHVVQQGRGERIALQRMLACPERLPPTAPVPSGWKPYQGDSSWFHCGFRGILEDRIPTPTDPQNECFYDHSGALVDENHPYAGCRGTPNQYDSSRDPLSHAFRDTGGIWHAGGPAFITSRVYFVSEAIRVVQQVGRAFLDALGDVIAQGVLAARAAVDPGNWIFHNLPARSVRHLNIMGMILGSISLSGSMETLLTNLTQRLDSFPIEGLLTDLAEDVNLPLRATGGPGEITAAEIGTLSLLQFVELLRQRRVLEFRRSPEEIAREQLEAQRTRSRGP